MLKRQWKWFVAVPVALVVLVLGGTFVYIHFVAPDPAPKLSLSSVDPAGSTASAAGDPSATAAGNVNGTWAVTDGSKVQYRVQEKLFGQDNTATGATTAVTGQLTIDGTTVNTGTITVDMTKVASDESQRDGQFRGRIMDTSQFPTATFELTEPIQLGSIPDNGVQITVNATGKLTLHGTTKDVTFPITAQRNGAHLEANGTIPITFSDYGIDNPSGGPASVGNNGDLEFLLVFAK